jgi:fucose permease
MYIYTHSNNPQLEKYYNLTYTIVSLVFLSPLFGYIASALLNDRIHRRFGQRGIAIMCSSCHLLAYIIASQHPPFPVLVVIFILAGFGNGLSDAAWNAWTGVMANANEVLGFLHACYGLGATLSPLIATSLITKANTPWYAYYYLMIGFAALEGLSSVSAFWRMDGASFRQAHPHEMTVNSSSTAAGNERRKISPIREAMFTLPAARTTWIGTAFLFLYLGVEVALGGWIVTFMMTVRHGSPFASGMTATGFWLGMTVGRLILGFVTPRIGIKLSVSVSNWSYLLQKRRP